MTAGTIVALASLAGTLTLGILTYRNYKRANDVEQQSVTDERAKMIAAETTAELKRLYERVDKLEKIVDDLQKRDRQKQTTIDEQAEKISSQAAELERTNAVLTATRALFVSYAARVEQAWRDGHTMPTLTAQERAILEDSISREQLAQLTKEQP